MLANEGYLLVEGRAPCDLASTVASMRLAGRELRDSPEFPILVDIREAGYSPDPEEARLLAQLLGAPELAGRRRVAFVTQPGVQFGLARMVSLMSGAEGQGVSVFLDFSAAEAWILERPRPPITP
jgi:hypothetical protein